MPLTPPVPPHALLARHAPLLREAAGERHPATAVEVLTALPLPAGGGRIHLRPRAPAGRPLPDVTYGRVARGSDGTTWLQYWFLRADNPQDRGILRTGRHEGDWEVTQVALDARGRPRRVVFAQHSWAESCAWGQVERAGVHPVVYVAGASHASYPRRGRHDRPWPDPTDVADGRGRTVLPAVRPFGPWVRWPGRWGGARPSGLVPGESPSPRGPAFQPDGPWADPSAFAARARPCGSGAPPRPWWVTASVFALAALLGIPLLRRVSTRRRPLPRSS